MNSTKKTGYNKSIYQSIRNTNELKVIKIPFAKPGSFVYILEYAILDDECFGIGLSVDGQHVKILMNIKPFLPVWLNDTKYLCVFKNLSSINHDMQIQTYPNENYSITSCSALDYLMNSSKCKDWKRYDIPLMKFDDCQRLYSFLNNTFSYSGNGDVIKTCGNHKLEVLLLLRCKQIGSCQNFNEARLYAIWLNENFEENTQLPQPTFDVLSFDIETVSHEDHRVPMGENLTDILFSASITYISCDEERFKSTQFTLLHLPIKDKCERERVFAENMIRDERNYSSGAIKQRIIEIFDNECDLLTRIFEIFRIPKTVYILLGYNSKGYDMMYLAKRLAFKNMKLVNDLHNQNGTIVYGLNMIHVDLMIVISKYFAGETSFSLKKVAIHCLDDENSKKVDLDARLLRYIYYHIEKNGLCDGKYDEWSVDLSKMMYYNDMDSILVYELWSKLQYFDFLFTISRSYCISMLTLSHLAAGRVSEYLSLKLLRDGFQNNSVFTTSHDQQFSTISKNDDSPTKKFWVYKYDNLALSSTSLEIGLGGGFNFRHSTNLYERVYSMDYVAYYPYLMDGFNLSPETISITTIGVLRRAIKDDICNIDKLMETKIFRFCTHRRGPSDFIDDKDLESNIESQMYINGQLDNCSEITDLSILDMLDELDRVVIILNADLHKRGILSKITNRQNTIREVAKKTKKGVKKGLKKAKKQFKTKFKQFENDDNNNIADDADIKEEYTAQISRIDDDMDLVQGRIKILAEETLNSYTRAQLHQYIQALTYEFSRINSIYRNLKIVNSSIYGLLGAKGNTGVLKAIQVAAVATCMGRKYIIDTGKSGESLDLSLILVDTDSTFFTPNSTMAIESNAAKRLQKQMASINTRLDLGLKNYENVFVIAKKTYFATHEGEYFCRGINKNGPAIWSVVLFDFYKTYLIEKLPIKRKDLFEIMYKLYQDTYEKLRVDKNIVLCKMNIKSEVGDYKTETPMKKLMLRISKENPQYVFGKNVQYFHMLLNKPQDLYFAIDYELENIPITKLNLYKFYSKINMAIYNILNMALVNMNRQRGVYYSLPFLEFNNEHLAAFNKCCLDQLYN